jgi:hypothetical protein
MGVDVFVGHATWTHEEFKPSGATALCASLGPAEEIALGDNSHQRSRGVDYGKTADALLQHQTDRSRDRIGRLN